MAAGLGYIEFTTGDILTAAAANGYLASQTVMVFANAAARTSAITSPQEGMVSYLKDTNAVEYYSGSAWTAVGGGSASGLTFIKGGTFTSTNTTSIDNCFNSTYENYRIIIKVVGASPVNGQLRYRLRVGGADASGSNYNSQRLYAQSSSVGGSAETAQTSGILGPENTSYSFLSTDIYRPFLAASTGYSTVASYNQAYIDNFSGAQTSATSYDGITLFPDSGTITGEVWVYGYAKS